MTISCVAVLCLRNEAAHIRRSIASFINQGIDVAIIDHASTDGTRAICEQFLGAGVVALEDLAWLGVFDLMQQMEAKRSLLRRLTHDWVIHADADEWMHTQVQGELLIDGIARLDRAGFNAINFEEFVFLPDPGAEGEPEDCASEMLAYYFFAPFENRLMRAWRRVAGLDNVESGGHLLAGDSFRMAPENFVLRHYIVLSQRQAITKYAQRVFSSGDLQRGWHGNRLGLDAERLRLPAQVSLKRLAAWNSTELDRSDPRATHFWDWPSVERRGEP